MVATARPATAQQMVTGTINDQAVTVPADIYILEAAHLAGIEVGHIRDQAGRHR